MGFNGLDLLTVIVLTATLWVTIKSLIKQYRETHQMNRLCDKYNRIDRQFAARDYYDDQEIYGDSLHGILAKRKYRYKV